MSIRNQVIVLFAVLVVCLGVFAWVMPERGYMKGVCGWFGYSDYIVINYNDINDMRDNDFLCYRADGKSHFVALSNREQ